MQDQLRALIDKHCDWLERQIALIADSLEALTEGKNNRREIINEAREQTHQITGTSGTMGFKQVSLAAQALENCLEATGQNSDGLDPQQFMQINTLFHTLSALAAEVSPEKSTLYNVDLSQITKQ